MKRRDFISLAIAALAGSQVPGWIKRDSGLITFEGHVFIPDHVQGDADLFWRLKAELDAARPRDTARFTGLGDYIRKNGTLYSVTRTSWGRIG